MHTFKLSMRIIARHWVYILVYLVSLSVLGLFVSLGLNNQETFEETVGRIALIDRDDSAISRGLADYMATFSVEGLSDRGHLTPVEDSTSSLADLIAQDIVSYVVIIPEGFGDDLMEAAVDGADLPVLETSVSYQSGAGSLMDIRLRQYLQSVYGYAGTIAQGDQARATSLAREAMELKAPVKMVATDLGVFSGRLVGYLGWSTYPLFASATVLCSVLMKSLNQQDVRRRTLAAPTTSTSRSLQTYLACIVLGILSCVWIVSLGIVTAGQEALSSNTTQLTLMAAALLAYALMSASLGFFLGQLGISEMVSNAIGNVGGMLFSFLGGFWIPLEFLGEGVQTISKLTPAYWTSQAINAAQDMTSVTIEGIQPSLRATLLVLLFAIAFAVIAFAVGNAQRSQA